MHSKKSLGQHFLRCQWVAEKIVAAANLSKDDIVVEVGPGEGALTRVLAKSAKKIIAVEKDRELVTRILKHEPPEQNTEIIEGDILKIYPALILRFKVQGSGFKVVGNIPYYLTSRIFRAIFENEPLPECIVFTIQKEVAQRICSKPPHMNLLGLSVQVFGAPHIIAEIPASCFSPRPRVDSAIIRISDISGDFFSEQEIKKDRFFSIIRAGFSQKRKLLTNTLQKIASKTEVQKALEAASLPPTARPEELSLVQWAKVVSCLK